MMPVGQVVFLVVILIAIFIPSLFKLIFSLSLLLIAPIVCLLFYLFISLHKKAQPVSQNNQHKQSEATNNNSAARKGKQGTIIDSKDYKVLDDDK
jgi:membrane protein implicated in regulation of membrane protease activity